MLHELVWMRADSLGTRVQLERLTSPEFERRFEVVRVSNVTVGSASDFKNQSIVATFRAKVVPLR